MTENVTPYTTAVGSELQMIGTALQVNDDPNALADLQQAQNDTNQAQVGMKGLSKNIPPDMVSMTTLVNEALKLCYWRKSSYNRHQ